MHDIHMIINEMNEKMKRGKVGMLRPLRCGVGDSSRGILSAWRHPLAFFTFFFFFGGSKWRLGFFSPRWKMRLAYFRSGMEMDLSWDAYESFTVINLL